MGGAIGHSQSYQLPVGINGWSRESRGGVGIEPLSLGEDLSRTLTLYLYDEARPTEATLGADRITKFNQRFKQKGTQ